MHHNTQGITLLEAMIVVIVLAATVALVLPMLGGPRVHSHSAQSISNLRGIHQSMYAYANGNREYLPGFTSQGDLTRPSVEERFFILLDGDYFDGSYAINPLELHTARPWHPAQTDPLTSDQYSFALLQINTAGYRQNAWRADLDMKRALGSDRNTGIDTNSGIQSLASKKPGQWLGYVLWADNHVTLEKTATVEAKYDGDPTTPAKPDHLFEAPTPDDAYMIHSGP